LNLTDDEKKMRDGQLGEAVRMAMSILVDLGEAIGAPEMQAFLWHNNPGGRFDPGSV
jgi:predicted aconitase